jgi:alkylhydroperoxidase/carboxymuconolactone decarboxylase family protein YurZ
MDNDELIHRSEEYLDTLFGPGAGRRHTAFLEHLENDVLRETLHRYHVIEADTTNLSIDENYLIGMCVLCATKSYSTAGMFARTLMHVGVKKEKLLEALARLSMWIGGIAAAEAAAHVQRAIHDYEQRGQESLESWFPNPPTEASHG